MTAARIQGKKAESNIADLPGITLAFSLGALATTFLARKWLRAPQGSVGQRMIDDLGRCIDGRTGAITVNSCPDFGSKGEAEGYLQRRALDTGKPCAMQVQKGFLVALPNVDRRAMTFDKPPPGAILERPGGLGTGTVTEIAQRMVDLARRSGRCVSHRINDRGPLMIADPTVRGSIEAVAHQIAHRWYTSGGMER